MLRERKAQLRAALKKLTARERLLYHLARRGLSAKKIAKEMGIKTKSVYPMKNAMIKKLQRIIKEDEGMARPESGLEES